ncbi:hypothetical protein CRUP_030302 [Coryphaenoides rupestris]|nr:hypothetical protein CRUP_030302 [Coryphaenoides rupestris]
MASNSRRWVLQPLSPRLDHSDLRSLAGSAGLQQDPPWSENALGQAKHMNFSQDEDPSENSPFNSRPSSPGSSVGSPCGFYSFVDDGSREAELNEAWMLSPQRQTQLSTLREVNGFRLQTYSSARKPSSLFQEQQSQYRVEPGEYVQAVKEHEERQLRTEIIRTQAPKNSLTLKKEWSSMVSVDPRRSSAKLQDGFSLNFQPSVSNPEGSTPATSGSIDSQQIDFSTARQQFQKMEQDRLNVLFTVPRSPHNTALHPDWSPPRPLQKQGNAAAVQHEDVPGQPCSLRDHPSALGPPCLSTTLGLSATSGPPHLSTTPEDQGPAPLSATLRDQAQQHPASDYSGDGSTDERTHTWDLSLETPIEREMRLAQEREENLRLSRGLQPSKVVEMVEIKSKSLFYHFNNYVLKGKERNPVGFLIQQEIQRDTKREGGSQQDNPNPYPNYNPNPNPEEGQPAPPQQGASTSKHGLTESKTGRTLEKHNIARGGERDRDESPVFPPSCCPHRHTEETEQVLRSSAAPALGTPGAHHKVLTPGNPTHPESLAQVTVVDGGTRSSITLKDSTGQGADHTSTLSAVQTPLNISPRPWRETLGSRRSVVSDVIQKEIAENLRRESELQKLRGSIEGTTILQEPSSSLEPGSMTSKQALLPIPWSPAVPNTTLHPVTTTRPSITTTQTSTSTLHTTSTQRPITTLTSPTTTTATSARPSIGPQLQRSLSAMLLEDLEESRRKLRLEESLGYNLLITSTMRHKNHKALRWESGVFNNQLDQ